MKKKHNTGNFYILHTENIPYELAVKCKSFHSKTESRFEIFRKGLYFNELRCI